jgi:hypothetical protein
VSARCRYRAAGTPELRGSPCGARLQHQFPRVAERAAELILAGWTMIEVFGTPAAGIALARRKLGCPDCGKPLRPWGHARERTVCGLHGTPVTTRPDRARCPACQVTYVVLDAALLPRRACAARLIGQALVAAAHGSGHRPARPVWRKRAALRAGVPRSRGRCHRPPPRRGARQPLDDDQHPDSRPAAGHGPGRLNQSAVPGSRLP